MPFSKIIILPLGPRDDSIEDGLAVLPIPSEMVWRMYCSRPRPACILDQHTISIEFSDEYSSCLVWHPEFTFPQNKPPGSLG